MIMFEFMRSDGITERAYMVEVYQMVMRNMGYICALDKNNADEIAEKIITHAVTHRNRDKKDTLNAYIRSLANSFVKELHGEQNRCDYLDETENGGYNMVADVMAWTSHEISYDVEGRKHLVDLMITQYLIMPDIVTQYCANALRAAHLEPAITVKEDAEWEDMVNKLKWDAVVAEFKRYSPATVLLSMIEMAQYIAKQQRLNSELCCRLYKEISAVPVSVERIAAITEKPTVVSVDSAGKHFYAIDRYKFEMCEIDGARKLRMDFTQWQPIGNDNSVRAVYAVDVSPLVNYLYEQISVPMGVDTKYIRWLGKDRNIKFLPSGTTLQDVSEEQYFIELRAEILTMLSDNASIDVLGITDDYVYLRPVRRLTYNCYRCKLFDNKVIDMPVRIFFTKAITSQ